MIRALRRWLAEAIHPSDIVMLERRYLRLRGDLEQDRWWLAAEFPEIKAFADRLIVRDDNYVRKLTDPPRTSWWSWEIGQFREQLRRGEARPAITPDQRVNIPRA